MLNRKIKRKLRKELHELLLIDDKWYKNPNTELHEKIVGIGKRLGNETGMWKKRVINSEEYLRYKEQGCSYNEIAKRLKVSSKTLKKWRIENKK